ncbi:DUF7373 family lipoprotein [Mycobacterium riyadhense]|uniref:DUF7373 family lipoprotein n=1 Tax=Mycobacterium riyadhense TaxID=486698 RepID=UPI001EF9F2B1|nr:hypothetical protein [Mycobacterium riyadhense]
MKTACLGDWSSRRAPTAILAAALAAVIALAAGCTTRLPGNAVKSGGPAPPAADVALLDPGNYPRAPRPPLGVVANDDAGHRVEAHRMAQAVVGPWEVDNGLRSVQGHQAPTTALPNTASLSVLVFGTAMADQAGRHHFLVGFASGRASLTPATGQPSPPDKPKILDNAVLRFASAADATAAAAAMAATNLAIARTDASGPVAANRLTMARYPTTLVNVAAVAQGAEAVAFTARGPYVLYQYAGSKDNQQAVADLITNTLDLQVPLIDHFQATPADQLATLPADPTGLLARTVPATDPDVNHAAVYTPRGALHFRADPVATQKMYDDAGIQGVSVDRTTVYEAIDPTAALKATEWLVRMDVPYLGYQSAAGITGLPSARCFDRGASSGDLAAVRYLCIAAAGRYAIKATAAQEVDAHQVMASQYLMLTAA